MNAYLDETQRDAIRSFALFAAFVVVLNLFLYRSWRTLLAFLVTLGVCLALSVGYIGATGGMFTLVSPMVPMTILVTATATLVYLHSRFVERPPERSVRGAPDLRAGEQVPRVHGVDLRHRRGLRGAHDLGDPPDPRDGASGWRWGSRSPGSSSSRSSRRCSGSCARRRGSSGRRPAAGSSASPAWLPVWSYRFRWPLVGSALALSAAGAVALFGLPGVLAPMRVLTDPVEYIDHDAALYRDVRRLEQLDPGLSMTDVWITGGPGSASEPDVLTGPAPLPAGARDAIPRWASPSVRPRSCA